MKFTAIANLDKRASSDLLIIPLAESEKAIVWPSAAEKLKKLCDEPIKAGDFKAKEGEIALQYVSNQHEPRFLLLGLGEAQEITTEKLRRSYAQAMKTAWRYKVKSLNVLLPDLPALSEEIVCRGICEGLLLANYTFDCLKSECKDLNRPVEKIQLITPFKNALKWANKALTICQGVYLARDLVNGNADDITPDHLAKLAKGLQNGKSRIETTVFNKKRLEKEGMGLLLAVSRGAAHDPVLIIAEYKGNPKSKDHVVLVGKGVTYDTGGLNLKPTGSMETMKCDMGGAAAVLAALKVASELGLKKNITAVVPATENAIGPKSYKPGDVYKSYLGKTVEITNTDAEGRLILADAISYAVKNLKPTVLIDIATLTGAIEIALGNEVIGFFANQHTLADMMMRAGSETYERVWRMPLYEEYKDPMRSEVADIKNQGGRSGGAITAAIFLQEFVGKITWAHLDIAATACVNEAKRYHPRFGTGVGVRLLIELLEHL